MTEYEKQAFIDLLANELNPKTLRLSSNQKFINTFSPDELANEYALIKQGQSKLSRNQRDIIVWKIERFLKKYTE
jgi:hypothetical protein